MFSEGISSPYTARIAAALSMALFGLGAMALPAGAQSTPQPLTPAVQREGVESTVDPQRRAQRPAPDATVQQSVPPAVPQQAAPAALPRQTVQQTTNPQPSVLQPGAVRRALRDQGGTQVETAVAPADGRPVGAPATQEAPVAAPLATPVEKSRTVIVRPENGPASGRGYRGAYVQRPWGWVPHPGHGHAYRAHIHKPHYGHRSHYRVHTYTHAYGPYGGHPYRGR